MEQHQLATAVALGSGHFKRFIFRIVFARHGLIALRQGIAVDHYINIQAVLSGLVGLIWVSALYLFDTGTIDQNLSIRLMMLLGALGFTISSMAIFKRVFIAYLSCLVIPMLSYLMTHDYLHQWHALLPSFIIYSTLIALVSYRTNQQIYAAALDQVQVATLTEKLQQALTAERQVRDELAIRADTDELTGIYNRRGLIKHLNLELARCKRFPRSAAALMIDIDHFKKINDTHGHTVGDLVLIKVVDLIRQQLRDTDVFGRFGGEEFLLILPMMEKPGALIAAERIRKFIEANPIQLQQQSIQITISTGVAIYHSPDSMDELITRADHALYTAKNNGRNRVALERHELMQNT